MTVKIDGKFDELGWDCEFNSFGPGDMSFSVEEKTLLQTDGIELGVLREIHGFEKISRSHYSDKTGWSWVETETVHPFGSEPMIKRKWVQAGNHIRVTSDIVIRGPIPTKHISIDSLKILGNWSKVIIYSQFGPCSPEVKIEEIDVSDFLGKEKQFDFIPLVLVFVTEDGLELEVGSGYDLWRWHDFAGRFNGKSKFLLQGVDDGLIFERKVLLFDEESEMGRNNFRFNWYFAWGKSNETKSLNKPAFNTLSVKEKKLFSDKKTTENIYLLDNSNWSEAVLVEGVSGCYPCYSSRQLINYLKQWFRSVSSKIQDETQGIVLCDVDPHICSNLVHLNGAKTNPIHWDYSYILGFWEWANKCLGKRESKFYIIPDEKSLFANLPSFRGMGLGCVTQG